jgi:hypothetical protein
MRGRGGYIGFNRVPAAAAFNSAASGVWTLREAESLKRGGTWPVAFVNPTQLSGLQLWLDASDSSTLYDATSGGSLVAADGTVKRWEDKSGNSRHATEATNGPQRKTAVQGGRDVLRFDGTNDLLTFSNIAIPASHTVFAVFGRATSGIVSIPIANSSAENRYPFLWFNSDNVIYQLSNQTFTQHGTANTSTGFFLATTIRTGTTSINVRLAGVSVQTVTTGGGVTDATSENWSAVGSRESLGVKTHHNGDIAELIIYNSALSDTNRGLVEAYLMAKWGLT